MRSFLHLGPGLLLTVGAALANPHALPMAELFQSCDFVHQDAYSFSGITSSIQEQLRTKLEGDKECLAAFNQLNSSFDQIDTMIAPFLREHDERLLRRCQGAHKSLELLSILDDFNRRESMPIDYEDPCFYAGYKREEVGQRMLVDYGVGAGGR